MQSAKAVDTLARRATQCSFSSAFHFDSGASKGLKDTANRTYYVLAVPMVIAGAFGAWKSDFGAKLSLPSNSARNR